MVKVIFETKEEWIKALDEVNAIPLKKTCANCEQCSKIDDGRNVCLQHTMEIPKGYENELVNCKFYVEDKCLIF